MCIGLVSHIPNELVLREFEDAVKSQGQFHRSQAGGQVPAIFSYGFRNELADFLSQIFQLKERVFL